MNEMPDPTRMFSINVVGIIIMKYLILNDSDYQFILEGFFLNPFVALAFGITIATFCHGSRGPTLKVFYSLPVYDRWATEW